LDFSGQEVDLRPIPILNSDKFKLKPRTMKKLLAVIALAAFVACNNSGETKQSAEDSARIADSTRMADSIANAQKMMQDTTTKKDTMPMQDTSTKKMKKK
jgi:hypothetical protein